MEFEIRNSKLGVRKAGVSLIAVLLFMLVATIAATATYKWLTSESRSSGSRLQKQEAYQSSMAGIENVRAWMTFNANDVGALIKQYKDTGKKIKLNDRLAPWARANQSHDVWLTGVNTGTAHNFKLKILSSGKSRGSAVHNEIAIFNVDGLYQVQIPEVDGSINFNQAFAGATTGLTNTDTLQSGIIHGDFKDQNNTPTLTKDFIVSGDAAFGGTLKAYGDLYIKGNIKSENGGYKFGKAGVDTTVVYIGGDISCADNQALEVHGDLLVDGKILGKCAIDVSGNLTIGGAIVRDNPGTKKFTVGKNLVFKKDAVFDWAGTNEVSENSYGTGGDFGTGVGGKSYLAKVSGKNEKGKRKINLGSEIYLYESFPTTIKFCQNACDNAAHDLTCGVASRCPTGYCEGFFSQCHQPAGTTYNVGNPADRYFSFKADENGKVKNTPRIHEWAKTDNVLKNIGDKYWERISKMNKYGKIIKSDGTIPQELLLKNETAWKTEAAKNNTYCGIAKNWLWTDASVQKLNDCYTKAKTEDKLYNGFLPIEWQYNQNEEPKTKKLDGKFVIYASTAVGNTYLPATEPNAIVMFYLERGTDGNAQLKGRHVEHPDWVYNYFIYSDDDINELNDFNIQGTVFLAEGKKMKKFQGGNRLNFKEEVIKALITAGFIKENPEFTNLITDGSASSGADVAGAGGHDDYFIASAPQLKITLESMYENNEPLPSAADEAELDPSFIILPRVIYLPSDPYGKLENYINLVNLNGSNKTKDVAKVGGCPSIPKTTLLYDHSNAATASKLPTGLHECNYSDGSQSVIFYVYVTSEEMGSKPTVQFDSTAKDMGANTTKYLQLECHVGSGEEFKVKVSKPTDMPDTWTITPLATYEGSCNNSSPSCTFKLNYNATDCGSPKRLFQVTTNDAANGTANFQITECVGCQVGVKYQTTFGISSTFRVNRMGLMQYCNDKGAGTSECETDGIYYQMMQSSWPDCEAEDKAWVAAVGFNSPITNNCTAYDINESWDCGISSDLKLDVLPTGVPTGCEAVIPPEDKNYLPKSSLVSGESATLYAQLKAKKVHVRVKFDGENLHAKTLYATSTRFPADRSCMYSDAGCDFELFTGDDFHITVSNSDRADFSYWKCDPATSVNCGSSEPFNGPTFSIEKVNGDNEIVVWFGQNDNHCFFDEFKTSRECTGSGDDWKYCFNYCLDADDCRIGNGALTDHAKWLVMGDEAQKNKLEYQDGKIWLDRLYNRDKKQSDYGALKVLSTVLAGQYGSMRAQFQVPQLGRGENDASANVNLSGFIMRSNSDASSYLMLNVFANREGKLTAKACIGNNCVSENMRAPRGAGQGGLGLVGPGQSAMGTISSTDIVTMTATLSKDGAKDLLTVSVVKGQLGAYAAATATIIVSDIEGYASLDGQQYVGFSLADPDFKLYDIGWKSETYNAECWDTYPTIKCSFSAAYLGGIVPQGEKAKPWVGLSSWFDEKGCVPEYYYNGDDACNTSMQAGYKKCMPDYKFTEGGVHGTIENGVETKMAKAKIGQCFGTSLSTEDWGHLHAEEALCGQFWVGEITACKKNYLFFNDGYGRTLAPYSTGSLSSDDIFALEANQVANLRSASINISMDNPNGDELEVYLRSETGYYNSLPKFSASAVTKAHHSALISVDELATSAGFDQEKVTAVIIRNHGGSNVTIKEVKSVCDNVTSIQCKDVVYTGGKFKVNVVVKHHEGVKSYEITATENGSSVSDLKKEYSCETQAGPQTPGQGCRVPDPSGRIAFDSDPYNPYANGSDEEKTYVFTVNALDEDGNPVDNAPCTTPQLTLRPIQGECRWRGDASSVEVRPGTGLPDFQYRLSDCGGGNCKWVISLDNASDIHSGTGTTQGGFSSIPSDKRNAFNTGANSFTVGSVHKIYFKNAAGATTEFAECYKEFTVTGGTSSGTVQSSSSVGPASSAVTSSSSSAVPGMITVTCPSTVETYPVKRTSWGITTSGESTLGNNETLVRDLYIGNTLISSKNCSRNDCQAMDDAYITKAPGTYTYSVKIGSQEMCRGSLVVNNPIVCSAKPDDITQGESFTLKASKASDAEGNPKDCKLTGNGVSGGDCYYGQSQFGSNITVTPTSAGTHHYKYEVKLENNNSTTETFKCEWDVKVESSSSTNSSASGGTSIEITQNDNLNSHLVEIQGEVTVTCKDGSNQAATIRCCPSDCDNGTLSSDLMMGTDNKGRTPRLYNASHACTNGQTVVIKSVDVVKCGVANY